MGWGGIEFLVWELEDGCQPRPGVQRVGESQHTHVGAEGVELSSCGAMDTSWSSVMGKGDPRQMQGETCGACCWARPCVWGHGIPGRREG